MAGVVIVIWGEREAEYLCNQDWTGQISLIWKEKLDFRRTLIFGRYNGLRCDPVEQCPLFRPKPNSL